MKHIFFLLVALSPLCPYSVNAAQDPAVQLRQDAARTSPAAGDDTDNPLVGIGHKMEGIVGRVVAKDTGVTVQKDEEDILNQIDAMIEVLKKKTGS
ncbi:MAG: hypothetical protein HY286_17735 [Planctomycetes bacterium]|nr:hypothetical protein [Planctomycetota bacterium]